MRPDRPAATTHKRRNPTRKKGRTPRKPRTRRTRKIRRIPDGMTARILDGKAIAHKVRAEAAETARQLAARGIKPCLAVVLVGEDPASQIYVRGKTRAALDAGLALFDHKLPASAPEPELLAL